MPNVVDLHPPRHLWSFWPQIEEGWKAFFDGSPVNRNPHDRNTPQWEAWRFGYYEGMDYGN